MNSTQEISSHITLLPEHIIDQIKAGEVIERPAHLIKEVLENSLDAGATEVSLHIVGEGMQLIAIEDNGRGMMLQDLPFAFCRHATSKIKNFEDLYNLHTFGFRGEALASIAAVSKINCISSQDESGNHAGKITLESGQVTSHAQTSSNKRGTSLYIKDLFYNTPARLKFIKSAQSEKNAIRKTIDSFVISHPEVSFTIRFDDQDKTVYPAVTTLEKRVRQLFYTAKKQGHELIHLSKAYEGHEVEIFLSPNSIKGNLTRKQFLFANDRLFIDKQIHQMVTRSMEKRGWLSGPGSYFINIKVPTSQLDVNVHPNKTYIKFLKHTLIMSLISNELKGISESEENELPIQAPVTRPEPTPLNHFIQSPFTQTSQGYAPRTNSPQASIAKEVRASTSHHKTYQILDSHLIHKRFLLNCIFDHLKSLNEDDESWRTPLLISEPFPKDSYITEKSLNEMRRLGFILDEVSNETIALRSIPNLLSSVDYKKLVKALLQSSTDLGQCDTSQISINETLIRNTLLVPSLKSQSHRFMIELDHHKLESLFQ